jgi:tripartite ATP-independent transporter DctM subunit
VEKAIPIPVEARLEPPRGARLKALLAKLDGCVGFLAGAILLGDALLVAGAVAVRSLLSISAPWVDELSEIALIWLAFMGAITAFHRDEHVSVGAVYELWPPRMRPALHELSLMIVVAIMGILAWQGGAAIMRGTGFLVVTGWTRLVHYAAFEIACLAVAALAAAELLSGSVRRALSLGVLVLAIVWICQGWIGAEVGQLIAPHPIMSLAVTFGVVVLVGVPLPFAFAAAAIACIAFDSSLRLASIPGNMMNVLQSFVLVAIPFFILVGGVLSRRGLSDSLLSALDDMTRPFRGGAAMAAVGGIYLMSGMSGSKMADIAATAPVVGPLLRTRGHRAEEGAALLCSAAAMSESIPPSIALIVLSAATNLSTGALFIAGVLPAAVVSLCIVAVAYVRARRRGAGGGTRSSPREFLRHLAGSLPLLAIPLLIRSAIVKGVATPSEVSSLAVVYCLLIAVLLYRVPLRELASIIIATARTAGKLLFLLCCVAPLIYLFGIAGISDRFGELALLFRSNAAAFAIASVGVMIVTGMIFEGLPAIVIFAPLFLPVAAGLGFSPLHFAVVLVMAMGVGAFAPPLGVGFFATCGLVGVSPGRAARETWIYLGAALIGIAIVAAVPQITLWLPGILK